MATFPLLDPAVPFTPDSVALLDQLMQAVSGSDAQQRTAALDILSQLKEAGNLWVHVDTILQHTRLSDTKFFALSVLENVVQKAWNAIAPDQREALKNYVSNQVISACSDPNSSGFLSKLNGVLVEIVKHEWTKSWVSFIPEICGAAKTSQPLCENTMNILKLLSEEIFDSSSRPLSSKRRAELKVAMTNEFSKIYELCNWVLSTAIMHSGAIQNSLIRATLSTLAAFLDWIPPVHVFSGNLTELLVSGLLPQPQFRAPTLDCLTEIAGVTLDLTPDHSDYSMYSSFVFTLLTTVMNKLSAVCPLPLQASDSSVRAVSQKLALFLSAYLQSHLTLLEAAEARMSNTENGQLLRQQVTQAFRYELSLTEIMEDEGFKICCEFWLWLAKKLYEDRFQRNGGLKTLMQTEVYDPALSQLRLLLVIRTAKPTEVLVSVDEHGNTMRVNLEDTEVTALYEVMRDTLVYLTHLDPSDMYDRITYRLSKQMDGSEWSWKNISSLSYAIGSISGTMAEDFERKFVVQVIKDLLALCEGKRGKENKAVVASNIMYVVMQYPRFLKNHWNFLKTVVKKLFEFMHEPHPGIKDMSCETLLRIAQKCGMEFVRIQLQHDQREPYLYEIVRGLETHICDLENHQKFVFYEALGQILSNMEDVKEVTYGLEACMNLVTAEWTRLLQGLAAAFNQLSDVEVMKKIAFVVKANQRVCTTLGHNYYIQLGRVYNDLMQLYTAYSQFLGSELATRGKVIVSHAYFKSARAVRREILSLLQTYVAVCQAPSILVEHFVPNIMQTILSDFISSAEETREAEVISLTTECTAKLKDQLMVYGEMLLGPFLDTILGMIARDFHAYPEHRSNFFDYVKALSLHCFQALLQLPVERFKIMLDSILWAARHQHPGMAETGLITMTALLENLQKTGLAGSFYQHFYLYILGEVFAMMTDGVHLSNFKHHCHILRHLFQLVEENALPAALQEGSGNKEFVLNHLAQLFSVNFTNMNRVQVEGILLGMFNKCREKERFKQGMRDFLISCKEVANDNEALYAEERQSELEQARELDRQRRLQVPGLMPQY